MHAYHVRANQPVGCRHRGSHQAVVGAPTEWDQEVVGAPTQPLAVQMETLGSVQHRMMDRTCSAHQDPDVGPDADVVELLEQSHSRARQPAEHPHRRRLSE